MAELPFVTTDAEDVARALAGYETQTVAGGPFVVTGGMWTYDAAEVDELFGTAHGLSGQFNLRVAQADDFAKVLIPADEEDGHSAGEAMHALYALNLFDALVRHLAIAADFMKNMESGGYDLGDDLKEIEVLLAAIPPRLVGKPS